MSQQKNSRQKSSSKNKRGGKKRFPIIGIGASAGGIEAFKAFFTSLPACPNATIICIIHLSLQKKSSLAELFAHSFKHLHFREILDKEVVRPGFVFINSSGKPVSIEKGKFKISLPDTKSPLLTINHLFRSLAAWQGDLSIGIILSGAGSDGTLGLREIKAAGGIVMAQKPSTAEFNIMPMSAITAGLPDFVASPHDLGPMVDQCINRLILGDFNGPNGPIDLPGSDLEALFTILLGKTNIHFEYYKKNVVARRVYRRMSLATMPSPDEYLAFLKKSPKEIFSLANDLMIGVTSFFRDPDAWEILQCIVVKDLISKGAAEKPLRVWVPACSTGEEAYTIAMMLQLQAEKSGTPRTFQIFATDINEKALKIARKGSYPASVSENIPDEYVRRYFIAGQDGSSMDIVKSTRDIVVFAKQNILVDPPFSKVDLIICRNLFIYLETPAQEKCLSLFHYALNPDGCLFMGNAESTGKLHSLFKSLGNKKCRLYKRIGADRPQLKKMAPPFDAGSDTHGPVAWFSSPGDSSVQAVAQQELLKKFAPAVVVINASYSVVYYSGPTNKFLSQPGGAPTNKLLDQVPDAMRNRLRRHLLQAIHDGKPRAMLFPMPGKNKKMRQVAISITFLAKTVSDGDLYAVSFEEQGFLKSAQEMDAEPCDADGPLFRQLEHELASTRDELQGNIEQLKSLNEEMHSSNEELQAANEELETSREELQSLNEELVTVNAQLQETVEAQEITKNDLNNFFISTDIPTIFLDKDLKIKRFTPAMTRIVKFIEADIGRPFGEFSQDNIGPELAVDTEEVLHKLAAVSREVRCGDKWFIRQTLPYRNADDRVEGVVVTFTDITLRKQAEGSLIRLASIVESSDDAIFSKDLNGVIRSWNQGAEKIFGYSARETIGQPVTMLLPADRMDEEEKILHVLRSGGHVKHLETIRLTKDGRRINVLITSSPLKDEHGRIVGVSKIVHDITDRKKGEQERERLRMLLEAVIEHSPAGIAVLDYPNYEYLIANKEHRRRIGANVEIIGRSMLDVNQGNSVMLKAAFDEITRTKKSHLKNDVPYMVEEDGQLKRRYSSLIFAPLLDRNNDLFGIMSIGLDTTDRVEAEQALRDSEERFKTIAEALPALISLSSSEDSTILFTNSAYNEAFGFRKGELVGRQGPDVYFDPADRDKMIEAIKAQGFVSNYQIKAKKSDGTPIWLLSSVRPINFGGKPAMLGASIDITERIKAEEALWESRRQVDFLASVIESSSQPFGVGYPDGRLGLINKAFERLTGYSGDELRTINWGKALTPPEWAEIEQKKLAELNDTGVPVRYEKEYVRKDGTRIPIELLVHVVKDGDGRPLYYNSFLTDITERKRAEEVLRKSEERYKAITSNTPDHILMQDLELRYLLVVNPQLGLTEKDMLGKTDYDILTIEDARKITKIKKQVIETDAPAHLETTLIDLEGKRQFFDGSYVPKHDALGRVDGLIGYFRNVTEQKLSEEALRESEERYRTLFNSLIEGFCIIEMIFDADNKPVDYRFLEINEAFEEQTGLHNAQGKLMRDLAPDHEEQWFEIYGKIAVTGEPAEFVNEAKALDRWFEVYAFRMGGSDSRKVAICFSDITERKKAENALREQNEISNAILNATTETLWLMDLDGDILGANETAAKRLGKSVAEVIGKNGFALTPQHVKELRQAKIREMARTGKSVQFQDERDGIIFNHTFYPVRDALGAVKGLVIFSRDITEQKKAEEALRISEERFRSMFERHQAVMLLIEPESGSIVEANAAAQKYYGYSREVLLSLKISDINQLPKEKVAEELKKALEERRTNFVFPHRLANGDVRWVEVYSSPNDVQGKKLLFSIIHDITDRKKGELELIQLNRTLSAHSKSSQAMMRAEHEENYLNEVCKIITNDCGYKMVWIGFAENGAQKSVRPVASAGFEQGYLEKLDITWDDTERGRGPTGTAIRTGKPTRCMNMLTDPKFKPWREEAIRRGYASSVVFPLLNGNKAFGAISIYSKEPNAFVNDEITLLTDLSDDLAYGILSIRMQEARKSAEEAVLKERNFCNAIIQTTSGLIVVLDPEGRIELFNHACEKATGYTYTELKGKPFWDYLLLPEERDTVKDVFNKIKEGNVNAEMEFENYWVKKDKSRRFIRWANSALKNTNGKVELIIGTGIDMTDDKINREKIDELNSFLMQKTTDLLAANKELESFSYSVSHDLRGPLRTIKGFSDILLEDYGDKFDANGQEFMRRIKSGADKMNELIDDMLSLAKISRQEMNVEEIDLSAMVSAIIEELQQTEPQRSIETLIAQDIHGRADARLVNIVLSNLIGNAWKYSSKIPHAVIEFGTVEISGEKTYFIKDNGAGFDMTHAKRLFTPFQRLHSENEFPGTGIGLAIVSKVIQRHGGRIWPESEVGKGASFHFTLSVDKRKDGGG